MESERFDTMGGSMFARLTQAMGARSRRHALRTALSGAAVATAGVVASGLGGDARKGKKKCKKCKPAATLGERCRNTRECCGNETGLACTFTDESDAPVCCAAYGAACGEEGCCQGLICVNSQCTFLIGG